MRRRKSVIHSLLKLAVDPRATTEQLNAGIDLVTKMIEAENEYNRLNPPPPPPSPEERMIALRKAANANLARRYKK